MRAVFTVVGKVIMAAARAAVIPVKTYILFISMVVMCMTISRSLILSSWSFFRISYLRYAGFRGEVGNYDIAHRILDEMQRAKPKSQPERLRTLERWY